MTAYPSITYICDFDGKAAYCTSIPGREENQIASLTHSTLVDHTAISLVTNDLRKILCWEIVNVCFSGIEWARELSFQMLQNTISIPQFI